jgi:ubiquinone/menaquinone biosynthesis C-methylase UbiE
MITFPVVFSVKKSLGEIKRVLRRGGTFVSITFSQPHFRVPLLATQELAWAVHVQKVKGEIK